MVKRSEGLTNMPKEKNWVKKLKAKIKRHFLATLKMKEATRIKKRYAKYYKKVGKNRAMTFVKWLEKERKPTY